MLGFPTETALSQCENPSLPAPKVLCFSHTAAQISKKPSLTLTPSPSTQGASLTRFPHFWLSHPTSASSGHLVWWTKDSLGAGQICPYEHPTCTTLGAWESTFFVLFPLALWQGLTMCPSLVHAPALDSWVIGLPVSATNPGSALALTWGFGLLFSFP